MSAAASAQAQAGKQHAAYEKERAQLRDLLTWSEQDDVEAVKRLAAGLPRQAEDALAYRDGQGGGVVHAAARGGATRVLRWALDADPAAVLLADQRGRTPLHAASATVEGEPAVAMLLELPDVVKAALEAPMTGGGRPLHLACAASPRSVRALLKAGADASAPSSAGQPVHWAISHLEDEEAAEAVRALLDAGADVDAREPIHGATPLLLACFQGLPAVVKELLARGADPKVYANNLSPLSAAAAVAGSVPCCEALLATPQGASLAKTRDPVEHLLPVQHAAHARNRATVDLLIPYSFPAEGSGADDPYAGRVPTADDLFREVDAYEAEIEKRATKAAEAFESLRVDGTAKFKAGDVLGALDSYNRAADVEGATREQRAVALSNASACLLKMGRAADARDVAQHAATADPKFAKAKFRLGQALVELGDHAGAAQAYYEAYQIDPKGPDAATLMSLFRREVDVAKKEHASNQMRKD